MWYLKSQRDNSLFYLLAGKTYTINRKAGDLVLNNDQSISRQHGAILISNEGDVFVWDDGSKYGTFVFEGEREQKLEPHQRTKIKIGDKVRFGLQWNIFKLCKMDFVVCTSSISVSDKRSLKSILLKIGGTFSNDWNNSCTHLAMNQVSLTHKVVLALAAGKPITTVQYWQKMAEAISSQSALPKIEDYISPVVEEELQRQTNPDTLLPNTNRKTLFQGKIFVFSSEDTRSKISHLVECAGGECTLVEVSNLPPKAYCEPKYIVVKESEACKQLMPDIMAKLKGKGLRPIIISEIGLAIYSNSLTRYCNPTWRKPSLLGDSPSQSQGICLVENTEDIKTQTIKAEPRDDIVIPPSLESVVSDTSMNNSTRSVKRPLSVSPADNPPPKRQVQKPDAAKSSGPLDRWLQRTGSSSAKDSEATCSVDTSAGDLFNTTSQNVQNASASSSKEDEKEPSPKKKRGRIEDDDGFLVPSPKKGPNAKKTSKLPSPIKAVRIDDDKIEDDDSDDEFKVPSSKKKVRRIEDDDDDFGLGSSSFKSHLPSKNRNAAKKTSKLPSPIKTTRIDDDNIEDDDSDDEFKVPSRKKTVPRIEEDDEFDLGPSSFKSRPVVDGINVKKTVNNQDARPPAQSVKENRNQSSTDLRKDNRSVLREKNETAVSRSETRIENSSTSTTSTTTSRGNNSTAPSLSEFFDKSVGVVIKKEEPENDEIEKELAEIVIDIKEISLYRKQLPLRDISTNIVQDRRPNFKVFKKSLRATERTRINLVVDHNASLKYDGVPDPDAPTAPTTNGSSSSEPTSQNVEDLFPLTNERSSGSRRKAPRRVPDSQTVDEWTVP